MDNEYEYTDNEEFEHDLCEYNELNSDGLSADDRRIFEGLREHSLREWTVEKYLKFKKNNERNDISGYNSNE